MDKSIDEVSTFDAKKEIILSLGVYELRGLARVLGVKSPTTKRRDELVGQILTIIENNKDLSLGEIDKRGRPFKSLSSVKNILDVISTTPTMMEERKTSKFMSFEDITVFNQDMPTFTLQSSDIFPSNGVLRKGNSFGYFIDSSSQRMVYISREQVQKYKLETGDFVDCAVFEINNGDKCFVKKINKINGVNAEDYNPQQFDDYIQTLPKLQDVFGKDVCYGGRNVILTSCPLYLNAYINNLLEKFKGSKIVFLGVNICFEDKNFINSGRDVFSFTSNYSGDMADGYDRIIDAINFVERMRDLNENVLLLVSDFENVLNVLDNKFQSDESQKMFTHEESSVTIAKKLISLAMAKTNDKNITTVVLCNKIDVQDTFIKNELIKISNIIE